MRLALLAVVVLLAPAARADVGSCDATACAQVVSRGDMSCSDGSFQQRAVWGGAAGTNVILVEARCANGVYAWNAGASAVNWVATPQGCYTNLAGVVLGCAAGAPPSLAGFPML